MSGRRPARLRREGGVLANAPASAGPAPDEDGRAGALIASGRRGFILIEATVLYLILAFVAVSLASIFLLTHKANRVSEETLRASQLAAELLAEVKLRKWDETQPNARPAYPAYTKSALGTDGEDASDKRTFDDIDDFNGWVEAAPSDPVQRALPGFAGYSRTVTVQYVTSALAPSGSGTDYKLVTVCAERAALTRVCLTWLATNL